MKIITSKEKNLVHFMLPDNAIIEASANGTLMKFTETVKAPNLVKDENGVMNADVSNMVDHSFEKSLFSPQLNNSNSEIFDNVVLPKNEKFYNNKFQYVNGKLSIVSGWKDPE